MMMIMKLLSSHQLDSTPYEQFAEVNYHIQFVPQHQWFSPVYEQSVAERCSNNVIAFFFPHLLCTFFNAAPEERPVAAYQFPSSLLFLLRPHYHTHDNTVPVHAGNFCWSRKLARSVKFETSQGRGSRSDLTLAHIAQRSIAQHSIAQHSMTIQFAYSQTDTITKFQTGFFLPKQEHIKHLKYVFQDNYIK